MNPMLANRLDLPALPTYVSNPQWWMEQKLDGHRLMIEVENGKVVGINRKGEQSTHPQIMPLFRKLQTLFEGFSGSWTFDGEAVGETYWVFDMPQALHLVTPESTFTERRKGLEAVFPVAWESGQTTIQLVDVARTKRQKVDLLRRCMDSNAEGVMLKLRSAPYTAGTTDSGRTARSRGMLKAKFVETVDCIINEVGREGKLSCSVLVYDDGVLRDVGSCKMTEQNLAAAHTGDVIEVRYLYATPEPDVRLYQPSFVQFRTDKDPADCTIDQLKITNKTVLKRT